MSRGYGKADVNDVNTILVALQSKDHTKVRANYKHNETKVAEHSLLL